MGMGWVEPRKAHGTELDTLGIWIFFRHAHRMFMGYFMRCKSNLRYEIGI